MEESEYEQLRDRGERPEPTDIYTVAIGHGGHDADVPGVRAFVRMRVTPGGGADWMEVGRTGWLSWTEVFHAVRGGASLIET